MVLRAEPFVNRRSDFFVFTSSWPNAVAEIELVEVLTAPPRSMTAVIEFSEEEPLDSTEPSAAVMLLERLAPADIDQLLSGVDLFDSLM